MTCPDCGAFIGTLLSLAIVCQRVGVVRCGGCDAALGFASGLCGRWAPGFDGDDRTMLERALRRIRETLTPLPRTSSSVASSPGQLGPDLRVHIEAGANFSWEP